MLEARSLVKEFGQLRATDDVSLRFGEGEHEMVFIVGPNGAGKSTLVNLLTGRLEPDEGSVILHGEDGSERDITDMSPDRRVKEGVVRSFQIVRVFEEMTVRENIRTASLSNHDMLSSAWSLRDEHEQVESDVADLIEQFRLEDVADEEADTLPHGDRKLLDVAMSFALDPEYLLLDEPTSGVGATEKEYVIETIVEASQEQNVTTVTIEHDMDIVKTYADRMIALVEGSVYREGEASLLETDAELRRVLLGVTADE